MNEEIELKIIELMDDGATPENSSELSDLIDSSKETKSFYESILISESAIKGFFGGNKAKELSNKIDAYVDEQFKQSSKNSSINFKPVIGFAIAASMAAIAFTFLNSSSFQLSEPIEIAYEDPQIFEVEEAEPLYISGEDMVNGLWGPSSELARKIGRDRYEIMYVIYEANKENFIDNNINQPKKDRNFSVDLSLVDNLDKGFVIDEVKRHIFCSC